MIFSGQFWVCGCCCRQLLVPALWVLLLRCWSVDGMFVAPNTAGGLNAVSGRTPGGVASAAATFRTADDAVDWDLLLADDRGAQLHLPSTMFAGLTAHGVSTTVGAPGRQTCRRGSLLGAFLGYKPDDHVCSARCNTIRDQAAYCQEGPSFD